MSPLHVFVRLYFSSLLRSLRHKLWWKYILFQFHYYVHQLHCNNIFFFISLYVHYVVIKTKDIIFLVNNKINFATTFTTPGSWKMLFEKSIFIFSLLLLLPCPLQGDSDKKNIILTFATFIFLLNPRLLLLPLTYHDQDNSFFISLLRSYVMIKRKIINLVTTFSTPRF